MEKLYSEMGTGSSVGRLTEITHSFPDEAFSKAA
jgi:hypothetical protein